MTPDPIHRINLDTGASELFFDVPPESEPASLVFGPGAPYTDNLYLSSNNRDGGLIGDQGGSIVYLEPDPSVNGELFLTPDPPQSNYLSEPRSIRFGPGGGFGTELIVNNSTNPPYSFELLSSTGAKSTLFIAPFWINDFDFGPGGGYETDMFVAHSDDADNTVYTVDASGNATPFATVPYPEESGSIRTLQFAPSGTFDQQLYAAVQFDGYFHIYRIDETGQASNLGRHFIFRGTSKNSIKTTHKS